MSSRKRIALYLVILAAIVGGGMALRLYKIGQSGFWLDEAFSELRTRGTLAETVHGAMALEGSPLLYLTLLHLWRGVLGTGEVQFRILSAILDGATILAVFALAREILSRRAALLGAGMYAISSFAVFYAQEARQYALLTLTVVLSCWFFHRICVSSRRKHLHDYFFYVAVTAAALYTFPYALFVIAAQGLFLAAAMVKGLRGRGRGEPLGRVAKAAVCLGSALVIFSPYFPVLAGRAAQLRGMQAPYAGGLAERWHIITELPQIARTMVYGSHMAYMGDATAAYIFALLFVAAPIALGVWLMRGPRWSRLFLALILLVPLAGVVMIPFRVQILEAKHIGFLLPFGIVAVCALFSPRFSGSWHLLGNFLPVAEGCLVVALFAGSQVYALRDYYGDTAGKEAWRTVAPTLLGQLRPGDAVIFSPYYAWVPCEYYLRGDVTINVGQNPFNGRIERKWIVAKGGEKPFVVPVLIPSNGGDEITSQDMREFLGSGAARVWMIINRSNVALEEPKVFRMIENDVSNRYNESLPQGFKEEEYPGGAGSIRVRLFEIKSSGQTK